MSGLPSSLSDLIHDAEEALADDRTEAAARAIVQIRRIAPDLLDGLRLTGMLKARQRRWWEAFACFDAALARDREDVQTYDEYARARMLAGDPAGALDLHRTACELVPGSALAWYGLASHYMSVDDFAAAREPMELAARLWPECAPVHLALGNVHVSTGQVDAAASEYRAALACDRAFGAAWCCLANIKTIAFTEEDEARMRQLLARTDLSEEDLIPTCFALAQHCETTGRYREAFELLMAANARRRHRLPWNRAQFSAHVRKIIAAFRATHALAHDKEAGHNIIFIVGMPRSGSTLVEQIISAHPQVEGGGELECLSTILAKASLDCGQPFPDWVKSATPDVWQELGQDYLAATQRWRHVRPWSTDKMLTNWIGIGAVAAMLPAARIVVCRRDPIETCWACFKQLFPNDGSEFSYDLDDTAAFWSDFDFGVRAWHELYPARIREQSYEALVENPEAEIRDLLTFCHLPYDSACRDFHLSSRVVRTTSAAQVREPLHRVIARAVKYGDLLGPLRDALAARSA